MVVELVAIIVTASSSQTITITAPREGNLAPVEAPGSFHDPLKAIQDLPGVSTPLLGIGGEVSVRGVAPENTRVLFDGYPIPFLYHFGGVRSVIPPEAVQSVSLLPGDFNASYGDAIGAVVTMLQVEPAKSLHASLSVDPLDSHLVVNGDGAQVSLRRSNLDLIFRGETPVYSDYYATARRGSVSATFLSASDEFDSTNLGRFELGIIDWHPSRFDVSTEVVNEEGLLNSHSIYERAKLSVLLSNKLMSGVDGEWVWIVRSTPLPTSTSTPRRYEATVEPWICAYVEHADVGVRFDQGDLSPRGSVSYGIFRLAAGRYRQEPRVSALGLATFNLKQLGYHLPAEESWNASASIGPVTVFARKLDHYDSLQVVPHYGYRFIKNMDGVAWGAELYWTKQLGGFSTSIAYTFTRTLSFIRSQEHNLLGLVSYDLSGWVFSGRIRYTENPTFFQIDSRVHHAWKTLSAWLEVVNVTDHKNGPNSIPVLPMVGVGVSL